MSLSQLDAQAFGEDPLRESLVQILAELRILTGNVSSVDTVSLEAGSAAFRLRQLLELAQWLEGVLQQSTLDTQAICRRQLQLSSVLAGSGKHDIIVRFLCALGGAPSPSDERVSTLHQLQRAGVQEALAPREPQHLHYLLMQARDEVQALRLWEQLACHDAYLTPDILVQIILNCGYENVVLEAWKCLSNMLELERRHLLILAQQAALPQIRTSARSLIGR